VQVWSIVTNVCLKVQIPTKWLQVDGIRIQVVWYSSISQDEVKEEAFRTSKVAKIFTTLQGSNNKIGCVVDLSPVRRGQRQRVFHSYLIIQHALYPKGKDLNMMIPNNR